MIFESPVLNWLSLAIVFVALPALLGLAVFVPRLFNVRSGCLPIAIFVTVAVIAVFGVTTYLNSTGADTVGEVLEKKEVLVYHLDGSWTHQTNAIIRYRPADSAEPKTEALSLVPARYDEMRQGDFVQLRYAQVPGLYRFVRLKDQSTSSQLWLRATEQPFFVLLTLGLFLAFALRLTMPVITFPILFFLIGFVTIGAWWITSAGIPMWDETAIRTSSLDAVSANVREIHRPYLGSDLRAFFTRKLFAPCELILLDMTPLGAPEPILSVDVVDRGTAQVRPGTTVNVRYLPADPRFALVPNTAHSYLWKNGMLITFLALLALAAVAMIAYILREQLGEFEGEGEEDGEELGEESDAAPSVTPQVPGASGPPASKGPAA
jgi:hypothetical protein